MGFGHGHYSAGVVWSKCLGSRVYLLSILSKAK
jgi:hypothetical protein